jgi:hypothetical protein
LYAKYFDMKKIILLLISATFILMVANAQSNIYGPEKVMIVGTFNGFATTPFDADYRTMNYRKVSFTAGSPKDGRGQWFTTINAQAAGGGDISPINMGGGPGNGFLLISGPTSNRFQNKWAFAFVAQGVVNGINSNSFNTGEDMGMNMNTTGYYSLVFNDCGYTDVDAKYYLAYTSAAPVNVTRSSEIINGNNSATIGVTTSVAPSAQEKVYIRYTTGADFAGTGSSSVIETTGAGTNYSATIPTFPAGTTVRYYVFTSTRNLTFLSSASEIDKSLSEIKFDDNANLNYLYVLGVVPVKLLSFDASITNGTVNTKWLVSEEDDVDTYQVLKSTNLQGFKTIGTIISKRSLAPEYAYNFTDNNTTAGKSYYQLQINKVTGEKKFSDIFTVNIKNVEKGITVISNASNSQLTLKMKNIPAGIYALSIFNNLGQLVFAQKVNRTDIYVDEIITPKTILGKGMYTLSFTNQTENIAESFFVL